jgi:hypothetical protein
VGEKFVKLGRLENYRHEDIPVAEKLVTKLIL